jgi:hypothetical protein
MVKHKYCILGGRDLSKQLLSDRWHHFRLSVYCRYIIGIVRIIGMLSGYCRDLWIIGYYRDTIGILSGFVEYRILSGYYRDIIKSSLLRFHFEFTSISLRCHFDRVVFAIGSAQCIACTPRDRNEWTKWTWYIYIYIYIFPKQCSHWWGSGGFS